MTSQYSYIGGVYQGKTSLRIAKAAYRPGIHEKRPQFRHSPRIHTPLAGGLPPLRIDCPLRLVCGGLPFRWRDNAGGWPNDTELGNSAARLYQETGAAP